MGDILLDTAKEIVLGTPIEDVDLTQYYTKTETDGLIANVQRDINADDAAADANIRSLSAAVRTLQGKTIPTKTSQLQNDSNYVTTAATQNFITGYTETDPTVPAWAKAANKPTYTASEVGALPTGTTLDNIPDGSNRKLSNYVVKDGGKVLSTNDYTTAEKNKLASIANGAQVNVIETVKVNNAALTPSSKAVNITVPTKTSDITNDSNYVQSSAIANFVTSAQVKTQIENYGYTTNAGTITGVNMNGASKGTSGVVNLGTVVTAVTVNGNAASISNGAASVSLTIPQGLPSVSASDNGKVMRVANGAWGTATPVVLRTGSGAPAASLGNVGDVYVQTS